MWESVRALFVGYMGDGLLWCLFFVALLFLFFYEKDQVNRVLFVYTPVVLLLLFFNPLFMNVMYGFIGEQIYYRVLWLIPAGMVIGNTIVKIYGMLKGRKQKCFLVTATVLFVLTGKLIYVNPQYSVADNLYHVPEEVVTICDAVEVEGREVMVAFPVELVQYVRQYSPYVCMPYGREVLVPKWMSFSDLYDALSAEVLDAATLSELAKAEGCHYIVIDAKKECVGDFKEFDYYDVLTVGKYKVLRDESVSLEL